MHFECCIRCTMEDAENWEIISTETLLKEVSNELIDMMIWYKATIRIGNKKYRRHIPKVVIDWAKKENSNTLS